MLPVEIMHTQGTMILRARNSELIIIPSHIKALKGLSKPDEFSGYFLREALVNRSARKLFEAWLRKDKTVWPRIYKTVHKEIDMKDVEAAEELIAQAVAKNAPEETPEKKVESEKAEAKEDSVEQATKKKTAAKKTATKKKTAAKKTATKKKTAAKKTATKKTTKKKTATKKKTTKKKASK